MGGTFDPIHHGHLVAASEVAQSFDLDEVIFVPTGQPWQKQAVSSSEHRYLMTVIATASNPRFTVSRVDIDRAGPTYTIDTLREVKGQRPDAELFFITGADALAQILSWRDHDELWDLAHFVAVSRPGHVLSTAGLPTDDVSQLEIPALGIKKQQTLVFGEKDASEGLKLKTTTGGFLMAVYNTNLTVDANAVELWWPAGYGKQPIYDVLISFTPEAMENACAVPTNTGATRKLLDFFVAAAAEEADYREENPMPIGGTFVASSGNLPPACAKAVQDFTTFRRRIGFRTVELIRLPIAEAVKDLFPPGEKGWDRDAGFYQQKDNGDGHWAQTKDGIWKHFAKNANQSDVDGESFYFKVNGVPIYMKVR
jgi:nicotinate-nucleotide adenylyltransferase